MKILALETSAKSVSAAVAENGVILAAAYQKAVKAFYAAGCRYLQLDDTSWGEFCSAEKREAYAKRGINVDEVGRKYVYVLNKVLEAKPSFLAEQYIQILNQKIHSLD